VSRPNEISRYDIGDLVRAAATFVSTDGVTPADPSTIDFLILNPAGTVSTYRYLAAAASVVRQATGAYWREFTLDQAGSWFYRCQATGGVQAAEEWSLIVDRSFIL